MGLDLINGGIALANKIGEFKEVAGRIAANTEFSEYHKVGPLFTGLIYGGNDPGGIGLEIADMIILLSERDLHPAKVKETRWNPNSGFANGFSFIFTTSGLISRY